AESSEFRAWKEMCRKMRLSAILQQRYVLLILLYFLQVAIPIKASVHKMCFLIVILGTETSNKYEIKNSLGQRIYFAVEESICFNRNVCSTLRACTLRITDNSGREVITVNRPLRCNSCWCPCYLQEVKTVDEKLTIGKISKYWSGFVNDVFTNADNFGIHVPADLDVTLKAAMIGACFLF
ncbi:hypothetical protein A6R68_11893, partial [Neotoma lepida]